MFFNAESDELTRDRTRKHKEFFIFEMIFKRCCFAQKNSFLIGVAGGNSMLSWKYPITVSPSGFAIYKSGSVKKGHAASTPAFTAPTGKAGAAIVCYQSIFINMK